MSQIIHVPAQQLISPYLLTPFHQVVEQPRPVPEIVKYLTHLTDPYDLNTNPYWQSDLGRVVLTYRSYVVAEFVRIQFHKQVDIFTFRKQESRLIKNQVKLEAKLWQACWNLIGQLQMDSLAQFETSPFPHPALTLFNLIVEQKLMHFVTATDLEVSVTQHIKNVQSQNRCLQKADAENPFPIDCFTGQFVEEAIVLAGRSNPIKQALTDVANARMAFVTCWKKTYPTKMGLGQKSAEKRGRKKLSK